MGLKRVDINPETKGKDFKHPIVVSLRKLGVLKTGKYSITRHDKVIMEKSDFENWSYSSYFRRESGANSGSRKPIQSAPKPEPVSEPPKAKTDDGKKKKDK